jgi:hypothetical protein
VLFSLPIIGWVNASSLDVMLLLLLLLPVWLNSIRLVPSLGRRICFGGAGYLYFSRCRGSMHGPMLSAVPHGHQLSQSKKKKTEVTNILYVQSKIKREMACNFHRM